jgi:hypothetical protein
MLQQQLSSALSKFPGSNYQTIPKIYWLLKKFLGRSKQNKYEICCAVKILQGFCSVIFCAYAICKEHLKNSPGNFHQKIPGGFI